MGFTKSKSTKKRTLRKKRVTKKGSVAVAVKKYVKQQLHKNVENKVQNVQAGANFGAITNSPSMYVYPMTPYAAYWTIGQGVTQNTRIGNQIKPVKVMLNYVIRPNPYDATTNGGPTPMQIDMFLGYVKATPSVLPTAIDMQYLFQIGNTSGPPIGNLTDVISSVNKDYWVIKKRWSHKVGYSLATGTGSNIQYQYFANNDFKMNVTKRLNITDMIPSTITFNDGGLATTAKGLFFFYQGISSAGNILAGTQLPCNIQYWVDFEYEDA